MSFTEKECQEFIERNLDKKILIFTYHSKFLEQTFAVMVKPHDFKREDFSKMIRNGFDVIGLEFTDGIEDCPGGYWSVME